MDISSSTLNNFKAALRVFLKNIAFRQTELQTLKALQIFLEPAFAKEYRVSTQQNPELVFYIGNTTNANADVLIDVKEYNSMEDRYGRMLLLYLQEKEDQQNHGLQRIISTNGLDWFVFEVQELDKHFFVDTNLLKEFNTWRQGPESGSTTYFLRQIAAPSLAAIPTGIRYTFFNLKDDAELLLANTPEADSALAAFFKMFSPQNRHKKGINAELPKEWSSPVCYANSKGMRKEFEE